MNAKEHQNADRNSESLLARSDTDSFDSYYNIFPQSKAQVSLDSIVPTYELSVSSDASYFNIMLLDGGNVYCVSMIDLGVF